MFIVRGQSDDPEYTRLTGKTSRGQKVGLTLMNGRLQSFDVYPSGFCRPEGTWRSWLWYRSDGDIDFEHQGPRFEARERSNLGASGDPVEWVAVISGELEDSGSTARGTIRANWSYEARRGYDAATCEGRVRFSARKKP